MRCSLSLSLQFRFNSHLDYPLKLRNGGKKICSSSHFGMQSLSQYVCLGIVKRRSDLHTMNRPKLINANKPFPMQMRLRFPYEKSVSRTQYWKCCAFWYNNVKITSAKCDNTALQSMRYPLNGIQKLRINFESNHANEFLIKVSKFKSISHCKHHVGILYLQ